MEVLIFFAAVFFYCAAGGLLWRRVTAAQLHDNGGGAVQLLTAAALCAHGFALYRAAYAGGEINLALGNAVSTVAWMSGVLFLAASLRREIVPLGLVVLPSGLIGFLIGALLPGERFLLESFPAGIARHLLIALPAYGILSIAFAQAVILWVQERQLRKPNPGGFFSSLPALETMESNLFYLTLLGFVLLSAELVTGMQSARRHYGAPLVFNHHVFFAVTAWAGFGGLLLGRKIFGWRGRSAAGWTMTAFAILALAYFGTRFVSAVILQRG